MGLWEILNYSLSPDVCFQQLWLSMSLLVWFLLNDGILVNERGGE